MKPIDVFNQNIKNAEAMLALHKLLMNKEMGQNPEEFRKMVHQYFSIPGDEETVIVLNEMLHALVRDCAGLKNSFFAEKNLNLLLRQAIVATCSAMDVYCNDILKEYVMTVIQKKGRDIPEKLKKTYMSLDEYLSISRHEDQEERVKQIILSKFDKVTLANINGITDIFEGCLGIPNIWEKIATRLSTRPQDLKNDIESIVKRRNDIVHRGDRKKNLTQIDPNIQEIQYEWTYAHIHAVTSFILTADRILKEEFPSDTSQEVSIEIAPSEVRDS